MAKQQERSERLERYRRSNVTVANSGREEGVAAPTFYQWKRKLGVATRRESLSKPALLELIEQRDQQFATQTEQLAIVV